MISENGNFEIDYVRSRWSFAIGNSEYLLKRKTALSPKDPSFVVLGDLDGRTVTAVRFDNGQFTDKREQFVSELKKLPNVFALSRHTHPDTISLIEDLLWEEAPEFKHELNSLLDRNSVGHAKDVVNGVAILIKSGSIDNCEKDNL